MLEKALNTIEPVRDDTTQPDVPKWRQQPGGYPRLAELIALQPESGIYRRFDALNARHLLYLQAELRILEVELIEWEVKDNVDTRGTRSLYATDYQRMLERPLNEHKEQLELIGKMHKKLEEYSECCVNGSSPQTQNMKLTAMP